MAGRKPKYQEFLLTLQELLDLNTAQFAKACGKQTTNISAYRSGDKKVGKSVVASMIGRLSEWDVIEENTLHSIASAKISTKPGVYVLYDSAGVVVYLGQASNLKTEVAARLTAKKTRHKLKIGKGLKAKAYPMKHVAEYVSTYIVESKRLRHNLEALLLRTFPNQTHNIKKGVFI